ncbi:uncharacterized protein LOC114651909 [Erpetoichthys calabaricus]|uniref:uncharacterized protein LOC114651909 n=1 Tax=Erpetoichthys calabaricus TaxID=27687 RepID=UPI00109F15E7|nr:uncharacterized protein LOC114651909 [Erpetoichthys calabaricus]
MGCRCCRMIKSYIIDPSVPVEVRGRRCEAPSTTFPHRDKFIGKNNYTDGRAFNKSVIPDQKAESQKSNIENSKEDKNVLKRTQLPTSELGSGDCPDGSEHVSTNGVCILEKTQNQLCGSVVPPKGNNSLPSPVSSSLLDDDGAQSQQDKGSTEIINQPAVPQDIIVVPSEETGFLEVVTFEPTANKHSTVENSFQSIPNSTDSTAVTTNNIHDCSLSSDPTETEEHVLHNGDLHGNLSTGHYTLLATESVENRDLPNTEVILEDIAVAEALAALEAATAGEDED